jgi:hypothetical protein
MGTTRLKLALGKTLNIGQYESLRIDVGVEYDVHFERFEEELIMTRDDLSDKLRELEKFMRLTHSDRALP